MAEAKKQSSTTTTPKTKDTVLSEILRIMVTSRVIDEIEQEYTSRGEAFFHVSGAGHEGVAVLNKHLRPEDYLHSHYRDKALLLARGVSSYQYFLALFNKNTSHSRGRQMNAHMSAPELNVLSIVGPVGNNGLHAAGIAAHIKQKAELAKKTYPITLCGLGEGTTQQGEFLESLTLAIRDSLPVLFLIEDNKYAISTYTEGKVFYQNGDVRFEEFLGCPITRVDGRYPHDADEVFKSVTDHMRSDGKPHIVVFNTERLASHTNADDHNVYREADEIQKINKTADPILNYIMREYNENEEFARVRFTALCDEIRPALRAEAQKAQREQEPAPVFSAKEPLPASLHKQAQKPFAPGELTMIEAMREVLRHRLETDPRVFLYGEDIEDPKGDVFGLTRGLSTAFENRVINSPLSESLIVGTAIGRSLAGARPVAFLQFADFFPLTFNQIYSELGSMYWRTDGGWKAPVIILATCGGYKPGLGPFHASVMESVAAHVPGIDVLMPSNAADAAGLLNAAFVSERPTLFFYPKTRLNARTKTISKKSATSYVVVPGTADVIEHGDDITLVGYGNTVPLCVKTAKALRDAGKSADVIDLRAMSPLDDATIRRSLKRTGALLVAHEDTKSTSISSEIFARVLEHPDMPPVKAARVVREDTYVPCNFENQLEVLPSFKRMTEAAVRLLGGSIEWKIDEQKRGGLATIFAVGSSPSDEQLTIMKWNITEGDTVTEGDLIAEGEADKAACDIKASVSGAVETLCVREGETLAVGEPLVLVNVSASGHRVVHTVTKEESGTPRITFTNTAAPVRERHVAKVCVSHIHSVPGARVVDNDELVTLSPQWTNEKILASTGIQSRHWIGKGQTLLSMTCDAARASLQDANLSINDISGIICATGTHEYQTPSLAARVQHALSQETNTSKSYTGYAYDVSAACSGYLFALNEAYHKVAHNRSEIVLVLTGEVLSSRIDMNDYGTAPVFSDAASATVVADASNPRVTPQPHAARASEPPVKPLENTAGARGVMQAASILQTVGEPALDLVVPETGHIGMKGVEVYKVAVTHLTAIAKQVCEANNVSLDDIDIIVPHQANLKIINGVARRLRVPMEKFYVSIDKHGNSSSNTIPICLHELESRLAGKKILLVAFGGGYTFAGALIDF